MVMLAKIDPSITLAEALETVQAVHYFSSKQYAINPRHIFQAQMYFCCKHTGFIGKSAFKFATAH